MLDLGGRCATFDPARIPPPSYRLVVIGAPEETEAFSIPALADALYVDAAADVPLDDVALVLVTPSGAKASVAFEPEPLTSLRNSGVPIIGLDVELADLTEMTGVISALRGVNDAVANDALEQARWNGQRPMYSYMSRSCPLGDAMQAGQGQMWIGGFGAERETPPLRSFTRRVEELRQRGAACIDILRRQQQAYIDSLRDE
jgi:hypothetical protein